MKWSIKAPPLDLKAKLFSANMELLFPTKTCEETSAVPVTSMPPVLTVRRFAVVLFPKIKAP